jgi:hypothetical protein
MDDLQQTVEEFRTAWVDVYRNDELCEKANNEFYALLRAVREDTITTIKQALHDKSHFKDGAGVLHPTSIGYTEMCLAIDQMEEE